jgi:prepilin-type N-terminal cleavage/methylation domain-containing protein
MNTSARRGFTLLELTTVIVIIGILCSMAVPNFLNAQLKAKIAASNADMQVLRLAINAYDTDQGALPPNVMQPRPVGQAHTGEQIDMNAFLAQMMAAQQAATDGKTAAPAADAMSNPALLRAASIAEGQAATADQSVSAGTTEVEAASQTQCLSGLALGVLVTPVPYLSQLPQVYFAYEWDRANPPLNAASRRREPEPWQLYVYGNILETSPEGYLLPGPVPGQVDYVICCPGPGSTSVAPPNSVDVALTRPTYDPTNGIKSDGELIILGP